MRPTRGRRRVIAHSVQTVQPRRAKPPRGGVVVAGAVVCVLFVFGFLLATSGRGSDSGPRIPIEPNVVPDPQLRELETVASIEMRGLPFGPAVVGDMTWITDSALGVLHGFDTETGEPRSSVVFEPGLLGPVAAGGQLWVAVPPGLVMSLDPRTGEVTSEWDVPVDAELRPVGDRAVVARSREARLLNFVDSHGPLTEVRSSDPWGAVGDRLVVVPSQGSAGSGLVAETFDLVAGDLIDRTFLPAAPSTLAMTDDSVWFAAERELFRLDLATGEIEDRLCGQPRHRVDPGRH